MYFFWLLVGNNVTVTKHVAVPQNQFQINPCGSLSQGMVPMTHTGKSRMDSQNSDIRKMVGSNLDKLFSGILEWQWKVTTFTRNCIFKFSMFPCYVSAPWVQQQALN